MSIHSNFVVNFILLFFSISSYPHMIWSSYWNANYVFIPSLSFVSSSMKIQETNNDKHSDELNRHIFTLFLALVFPFFHTQTIQDKWKLRNEIFILYFYLYLSFECVFNSYRMNKKNKRKYTYTMKICCFQYNFLHGQTIIFICRLPKYTIVK